MSIKTVEIPKSLNSQTVQPEKFLSPQKIAQVKGVRTLTGLTLMEAIALAHPPKGAIAENAKRRQDASRGKVSLN